MSQENITISKAILLNLIEGMEDSVKYTMEQKTTQGYAFAYGYIQSQMTQIAEVLRNQDT